MALKGTRRTTGAGARAVGSASVGGVCVLQLSGSVAVHVCMSVFVRVYVCGGGADVAAL